MAKLLESLTTILRNKRRSGRRAGVPRRREPGNPPFTGRSSTKEIEEAPPERAAELAGHAVERVDT